ncbi:MAG: hypothetical protein RSD23_06830 [Ruthenibacterium sp.]
MRTQKESVKDLLAAIQQAETEEKYNIGDDIKMLKASYTKLSKSDYLILLTRLLEKYSAGEQAEVHAALMQKIKRGDVTAIRLYHEMQQANGSGGDEVQIIDDI